MNNSDFEKLTPILNSLIRTVDEMYPENKGFIVTIGINNDGLITTNVGGNGRSSFATAAKITLDTTHYIGDVYGKGEKI